MIILIILITIVITFLSYIYLFPKKQVIDDSYNLKDFNNEDLTSLLDCDFIDRDLTNSPSTDNWDQEMKPSSAKTKLTCSLARSLVPVFCHDDEDKVIFTNLIDYLSKQNDEDLLKVSMKIIQEEKRKIEELDEMEKLERLEEPLKLEGKEVELEQDKQKKMEDLIRSIEEI